MKELNYIKTFESFKKETTKDKKDKDKTKEEILKRHKEWLEENIDSGYAPLFFGKVYKRRCNCTSY